MNIPRVELVFSTIADIIVLAFALRFSCTFISQLKLPVLCTQIDIAEFAFRYIVQLYYKVKVK